jgi:hypothetical protein
MGSPFSHCAVLGAGCLSSLYPRPSNGNLKILAESGGRDGSGGAYLDQSSVNPAGRGARPVAARSNGAATPF